MPSEKFLVRKGDPVTGSEDRENRTSRARLEMMRMRNATVPKPEWEEPGKYAVHREKYEKHLQESTGGWTPDLKRRVASHWKKLNVERRNGPGVFSIPDLNDEPHFFDIETEVLRVRWLAGPKQGAVETVDPLTYLEVRRNSKSVSLPQAEPVPDDEPECPPARPANMPSDYKKARTIAAKGLKVDFDSITFKEAAAYFRARPPKQYTF